MKPATEIAIAVLCAFVLALIFWSAAAWTPLHDWNGARFYPAYLLAAGESIYPGATGGIVNGWIYGPLLPLLLAPLSRISDPTWAMVTAGWVNILVLFGPVILIVDAGVGRTLSWPRRFLLGLAVAGALVFVPTTAGRLVFITCDQLAIGLGCGSCFWLAAVGKEPGWGRLFLAATFAGLAIWTKQTEVFLPIGQLVFLGATRSWRAAGRYMACLVVTQAVLLGLIGSIWGWREVWLNLVWIPANHPLAAGEQGLTTRALMAAAYVAPLVLAGLWMRRRSREVVSPDDKAGREMALQFLIVGAVLTPAGVLAAAKMGGDENSFHFVYFFALAAVFAAGHWIRAWLCARPVRVALAAVVCVGGAVWWVKPYAPVRLMPAPQLRAAVTLAAAEPGQVIFPRNPLVTWITERKQYHLEYGIFDRSLAGLPLAQKEFWRGMPAQLRHAVYPVPGKYFFMQLFPGVRLEAQRPDLAIYALDRPAPQK